MTPPKNPEALFQERIATLQASGVKHFPAPPETTKKNTAPPQKTVAAKPKTPSVSLTESHKFFVLSEFPDPSPVVLNLLKRLGIDGECQFACALENIPEDGPGPKNLNTTTQQHMKNRLQAAQPRVLFCFGARALGVLFWAMNWNIKGADLLENQRLGTYFCDQNEIEVFFLSSSKDLTENPPWRRNVWQVLEGFKKH